MDGYGNEKARGVCGSSALQGGREIHSRRGIFRCKRQLAHGRNQPDIGTSNGTLRTRHPHGGFRSGTTAILLRAIPTRALTTIIPHRDGYGFVARNLFLDGLNHPALAALGITGSKHLFGNNVIAAGFDLAGFSMEGGTGRSAEHRATRGKTERNGGHGKENSKSFHGEVV